MKIVIDSELLDELILKSSSSQEHIYSQCKPFHRMLEHLLNCDNVNLCDYLNSNIAMKKLKKDFIEKSKEL